jgi:hypothetical protein
MFFVSDGAGLGGTPGGQPLPNIPLVRPSILDPFLSCDPCIDPCRCADQIALYLHNRPIALLAASAVDRAGLDGLLQRLRRRPRRGHGRARPG